MFLFEDIVANKKVIASLDHAITNRKVSHGYIFHGDSGTGKLFMAQCFAKKILCVSQNACGECYSCGAFDFYNHPDVIYVKGSKKNIGVDDVREVIAQAYTKPYSSAHKIFILDYADGLSNSAQNALLKILEEPPHYIIFILIAQNLNNFLSTVISRCVCLKINPVSQTQVRVYLSHHYKLENEQAKILSIYSRGRIGLAIKFASDKNFGALRENIIALLIKLLESNSAHALLFLSELENLKEQIDFVLDIIYLFLRDLIVYKNTRETMRLYNLDSLRAIIKLSGLHSNESLYKKISVIDQTKRYLGYNTNFKLTMSVLLISLCQDELINYEKNNRCQV